MNFTIFWQCRPVPVRDGVHYIKDGSHNNSGHRSHDEIAERVLIRQDYHKEELDGVHYGIERVLHPADCASKLFLDTLLEPQQIKTLPYQVKCVLACNICVMLRSVTQSPKRAAVMAIRNIEMDAVLET